LLLLYKMPGMGLPGMGMPGMPGTGMPAAGGMPQMPPGMDMEKLMQMAQAMGMGGGGFPAGGFPGGPR
jgi:hypothetical protein